MQHAQAKFTFSSLVEFLTIGGLLLHALLLLLAWGLLPESIPVHFNPAGRADAWGARTDLLLLFGLSVLFYAGLTWLGRYPQKFNYPWEITEGNAAQQYRLASSFVRVIKLETVWLFAIISVGMVGVSLGQAGGLGYLFAPLVLVVTSLTIIGYFVAASRSA